jgi:4-amino-4-deoxy-L-arabinose transferase-like glycosyltransferase
VRLLAIGLDTGYEPRNDAYDYHRHAVSIAAGDGYPDSEYGSGVGPTALRPPAYPVALGAVYAVSGDSVTAGRVLGAFLGALSAALIFFISAPLWGRKVAILAASIFAIYPPLVHLPLELFSENLFIPLTLAAVLCAVRYRSSAQMRWAAATGVACGLALLTRNVGLALLVPLLLAVWFGGTIAGRRLAAPAVALACVLVVVFPWTLRNLAEFDRVIPIAASSGVTLAGTYNDEAGDDDVHPAGWRNPSTVAEFDSIFAQPRVDEATLDSQLRSRALDYAGDHPGYVVEASWENLKRLFLLEGGSVVADGREVTISGIGNTSTVDEQIGLAIVVALALIGLAAAGAAGPLSRRSGVLVRRVPWFVWLLPALILITSLPLGGLPRYRLAIDPFLAMFAALGLVAMREQIPALFGHKRGRSRARATAALTALLAIVLLGGCGGDDSTPAASTTSTAQVPPPTKAEEKQFYDDAEAICTKTIAQTEKLRRRITSGGIDTTLGPDVAITRGIVKPGLRILEHQAAQMRAIALSAGQNEAVDTYVGLFDVINELLRRRIDLGLQGATADAQNLELLIADVGDEQRAAAATLGFDKCATDFLEVLLPPDAPG